MIELDCDLPKIYLKPGELHLARRPAIIRTILGSCVGVTFWSARLRVGALCHAMLPWCPQTPSINLGLPANHRYVDSCIRYLAQKFDELGATRSELQIKVFGGGDVLPVSSTPSRQATVGAQNCKTAMEVLREEGLVITASDLGGAFGRIILFDTGTGEVLLRRLLPTLGDEEFTKTRGEAAYRGTQYDRA